MYPYNKDKRPLTMLLRAAAVLFCISSALILTGVVFWGVLVMLNCIAFLAAAWASLPWYVRSSLHDILWFAWDVANGNCHARHKKTGGTYLILGDAQLEKFGAMGESEVLYQDVVSRRNWVRPHREFHDGRFEIL